MGDNIYLTNPHLKYKESFLNAVEDYKNNKEPHIVSVESYLAVKEDNLRDLLQRIANASKGIGLPDGYVPSSQYWLIKDEKYIGTVDIRHKLSPFLEKAGGHIAYEIAVSERSKGYSKIALKKALEKAKDLGIYEPMVMCDIINNRSRRCIESIMTEVGGKVIEPSEVDGKINLRYLLNASGK